MRRLTEAGLLHDTGERTTGRGRVGSYYALADDLGRALVVSIAPQGIVAETVDVRGQVVARVERPVGRPARPAQVTRALRAAAVDVCADGPGTVRLAVVSAADPVDRASGRLVHLPDAPFLVGELSPADTLAPLVTGPVHVDNDVNWAARAERVGTPENLDNFAYVHLGEGLGCSVVSDGEVGRGHTGLAGEIAHVITVGPTGTALALIDVFAALGLRAVGTTAVDDADLIRAVTADTSDSARLRTDLGRAVSGVLAAVVALTDPELIVIGGSWGTHPAVLDAVTSEFDALPRHVPVRAAAVTVEPSLAGARGGALEELRRAVLDDSRTGPTEPAAKPTPEPVALTLVRRVGAPVPTP